VSGCRYGVDAAGMVVTSGPRDCSVAGSAQLGKRSSQKRAWSCRWELALAHLGAYLLAITAAAIVYAFVAVTIYLCCGYADRLASKVGPTGTNVILKLSASRWCALECRSCVTVRASCSVRCRSLAGSERCRVESEASGWSGMKESHSEQFQR